MVGILYMYIITSQRTLFTQSFFALEVEIGEKRECGKASKVELQQDHHRVQTLYKYIPLVLLTRLFLLSSF